MTRIDFIPTPNGDGTVTLRATPGPGWLERLRRRLQRMWNAKS
jgi:hypothetical protein